MMNNDNIHPCAEVPCDLVPYKLPKSRGFTELFGMKQLQRAGRPRVLYGKEYAAYQVGGFQRF